MSITSSGSVGRLRRPAPLLHAAVDGEPVRGGRLLDADLSARRLDASTIIGVAGVQGALSSRGGLFLEGGCAAALQKNDDDVRITRIVSQVNGEKSAVHGKTSCKVNEIWFWSMIPPTSKTSTQ